MLAEDVSRGVLAPSTLTKMVVSSGSQNLGGRMLGVSCTGKTVTLPEIVLNRSRELGGREKPLFSFVLNMTGCFHDTCGKFQPGNF